MFFRSCYSAIQSYLASSSKPEDDANAQAGSYQTKGGGRKNSLYVSAGGLHYVPGKTLGIGTFAEVRELNPIKNNTPSLAVKRFKKDIGGISNSEEKYLKKAYPEKKDEIAFFKYPEGDFRLVMPNFGHLSLDDILLQKKEWHSLNCRLSFVLKAILELKKLQDNRIAHGDVNAKNILFNADGECTFIDGLFYEEQWVENRLGCDRDSFKQEIESAFFPNETIQHEKTYFSEQFSRDCSEAKDTDQLARVVQNEMRFVQGKSVAIIEALRNHLRQGIQAALQSQCSQETRDLLNSLQLRMANLDNLQINENSGIAETDEGIRKAMHLLYQAERITSHQDYAIRFFSGKTSAAYLAAKPHFDKIRETLERELVHLPELPITSKEILYDRSPPNCKSYKEFKQRQKPGISK